MDFIRTPDMLLLIGAYFVTSLVVNALMTALSKVAKLRGWVGSVWDIGKFFLPSLLGAGIAALVLPSTINIVTLTLGLKLAIGIVAGHTAGQNYELYQKIQNRLG